MEKKTLLTSSIQNWVSEEWSKILTSKEGLNILEPISEELAEIRKLKVNIYPARHNIFRLFRYTDLKDIRVVILGQDPYYTPNVANGLAFAIGSDINKIPPSLRNVANEVKESHFNYFNDDKYLTKKFDYTLESWAKQGVFLLNTALTVEENRPNSHVKIWKPFIDFVFLNLQKKDNVVYLLWGNNAKKYKDLITNKSSFILESAHPSPLATGFIGNGHFIKTNEILKSINNEPIEWI